MAIRTFLDTYPEQSTLRYTAVIKDDTGTAIPAASLSSLTLTLYALDTAQTIVNSVNAVNILNTGRGTVDASGNLVIVLTPSDTIVVAGSDRRIMLIKWTYAAGAKAGYHEVEFAVRDLAKVT